MRISLLMAVLALFTCKTTPHTASNAKLIGGSEAHFAQFPGVLALPGCTGTIVGKRHIITAAHCVAHNPAYAVGQTLNVTGSMELSEAVWFDIKIADVTMHPEFKRLCETATDCGKLGVKAPEYPPDVAVIKVEADIPNLFEPNQAIPENGTQTALIRADIEFDKVSPSDNPDKPNQVYVAGYGCTEGHNVTSNDPKLLRWDLIAVTGTEPMTGIRTLTAPPADPNVLIQSYTPTRGALIEWQGASLCPGDSGGPIFKMGADGRRRLAGINSSAWWPTRANSGAADVNPDGPVGPIENGIPAVNLHTRLDRESRYHVDVWLKEVLGLSTNTQSAQ